MPSGMACDQAAQVGLLSHSLMHEGCESLHDNDKRVGFWMVGFGLGPHGGEGQGASTGLPGRRAAALLPRGPLMCRASSRLAGFDLSPTSLNPLTMTAAEKYHAAVALFCGMRREE
jgi:hypothetical protein